MNENDVKKIARLREYIISCYGKLDGKNEMSSIIKQSDVAASLEMMIKQIDDILKPYVNFT